MKRLLPLIAVLCLCGPALAEPAAPVPPPWQTTKNFQVLSGADTGEGGLAVEWSEFTGQIYGYTMFVYDWVTQANASFKELEQKVETLEDEVADLKGRVAALETDRPSDNPTLDRKLVETAAAFTELIEAHNKRLAELESKVAKLESERGIFKAPFKVVDAKGATLFSVAADGRTVVGNEGQSMIVMKASGADSAVLQLSSGEKKLLLATDRGSGTTLQLNDGADAVAKLSAEQGDDAFLRLAGGSASAILNADPDDAATLNLQAGSEAGIAVSSKTDDIGILGQLGGRNALSLGAMPGKGVALRLFDTAGNQVVTAAPNPAQGGAGVVAVGNGGPKSAAKMEAHSDASGLVHAYSDDGVGGAALAGGERSVVAYNKAGNPVASIGQSDKSEGGTLVARNPEGDGIFAAGFAAEYGGGEACVWRAKRSNTFCLGLGMPGMGVGK